MKSLMRPILLRDIVWALFGRAEMAGVSYLRFERQATLGFERFIVVH